MNDFTKEELTILYLSISGENYRKLKDKLQSMIDSYCEHDLSGGEVEEFIDTCSKCNAFILREAHYDNQ